MSPFDAPTNRKRELPASPVVSPLDPVTAPVVTSHAQFAARVARREPFVHSACHTLILPHQAQLEDVGVCAADTLYRLNSDALRGDVYVLVSSEGAPLAWVGFAPGSPPRLAPHTGTASQAKRVVLFRNTVQDFPHVIGGNQGIRARTIPDTRPRSVTRQRRGARR